MPKIIKPLTETEIRNAKPKEKEYRLYDGEGLYIIIYPDGRKRWRLDYVFNKKRNTKSLGKYPEVSLKKARELKREIKKKIKEGINPSSRAKVILEEKNNSTFKDVALEYFKIREDLSENYIKDSIQKLKKNIFPYVGHKHMDDIESLEMLDILLKIDKRGANVTAKKTFSIVERIYKYAVMHRYAKRNIMSDLDKRIAFRTVKSSNFKHTTDPKELKEILLAIDMYKGDFATKIALKILPYVFVRPFVIRHMEWDEIDFENKMWEIPKEKMKTKREHLVPLTNTVIKYINEMKEISYGVSKYVFPSKVSNLKPLSENTLNFALKRLGFDVTAHGFRHTASTILHENMHIHKLDKDVIEIQLAHTINGVRGTYNKAEYIEERIRLMQWWSDYLDNLKTQ